jgi:Protein of unknown function (DUF4232)
MNRDKAARIPRIIAPASAAALVLGLAGLIAAHQSAQATAAGSPRPAVSWVDHPVSMPAVRAPHNPGIAVCTSRDLSVRLQGRGLIQAGFYAYTYRARNTSGHACYVSGRPSVKLSGQALANAPNVLDVTAGVLARGASATFAVTQSARSSCTPAVNRDGVLRTSAVTPHVGIAARPVAAAGAGKILTSRCNKAEVTPIGLAPEAPKPDQLSPLVIRLQAPARARAGQVLKFTVLITNPTRAAIRLAPCPDYQVGISSAPAVAYRLNCSAPVLRAGQSRAYDMRYAVPAGTPAGLAKIGWFLFNSTRTGAGGVVTITR